MVAPLDGIDRGARGFGSTGTKQLHTVLPTKREKGYKEKESSITITRITIAASAKLGSYGGQRGAGAFFYEWVGPGIYQWIKR